jgi:hypothetical protein
LIPVWEGEVSAGKDPGLPGVTGQPNASQPVALGNLSTDLDRQAAGLAVPVGALYFACPRDVAFCRE